MPRDERLGKTLLRKRKAAEESGTTTRRIGSVLGALQVEIMSEASRGGIGEQNKNILVSPGARYNFVFSI